MLSKCDCRSATSCRYPVAFAGKRIGRQTDPTRQGRGCRERASCRSEGRKTPPYVIKELPINAHSSYPYLRYLCEILLLAPDMQQGLCIAILFKERCIISWGASLQATLYLTYMYSCCCLVINKPL